MHYDGATLVHMWVEVSRTVIREKLSDSFLTVLEALGFETKPIFLS